MWTAVQLREETVVVAGLAHLLECRPDACFGERAQVATREVQQAGLPVVVRDRGRRLGGRMASRTTEGRPVDTGASYFTAADPAFVAVVEDWHVALAREWTDTFAVFGDPDKSSTSGPVRWGAAGGLRSLVEDLATGLDVRSATVERIDPGLTVEGQSYAAVVLAMPDPQARRLLDPADADAHTLDDPYEPVLALTAVWPERRSPSWTAPS